MHMKKTKRKKIKKKHYFGIASALIVTSIFIIFLSITQSHLNNENTASNVQAAAQVIWQQFDGNAQKSGTNDNDPINASNVKSLQKLWQAKVSSDGSPVFLSGVTTSQGVKNLVYVTTERGGLIAFDEATGKQIWSVATNGDSDTITSSPAIDPANQYIYNYGADGKVHKYNVGTGAEETSGGWPLTITLIPNIEKGSSAIAIGNGYLYMTTSAYPGDAGQYVGHIVAKNLTSGAVSVFNTLCANETQLLNRNCSDANSGVWSRPGAVVDPNTGNIFIATGNGPYAPPNNLADSVIELTPNLSKIVDTYTPTNFQELQDDDADLGSTDVGIIPSLDIGIQGSKDNKIRVLNLKNLSGKGGPDHIAGELQTISIDCNIFSQPISWTDNSKNIWVFITDMCNNLYAYKVINNNLQKVYESNSDGGSSPLMVNGVLFIESSNSIKAIDPTTGDVFWTGTIGNIHWQSPAVIDGHVFTLDNNNLTAFAVPGGLPTSAPVNSPTLVTPVPSKFVCLGSCPTASPIKTPIPTVVSVPSQSPIISNPCQTGSSSVTTESSKQHQSSGGGLSNLLQIFLQFIIQLLQLLFGGRNIGVPTPCASPTS